MSDAPRAACPDCGQAAERLISAGAGLLFKGDGFYITDHRSDDYKREAGEGSGSAAGTDNGKDPKSANALASAKKKNDKPAASASSAVSGLVWRQVGRGKRRKSLTANVSRADHQALLAAVDAMGAGPVQLRLERPNNPAHGDLASNVALALASAVAASAARDCS